MSRLYLIKCKYAIYWQEYESGVTAHLMQSPRSEEGCVCYVYVDDILTL